MSGSLECLDEQAALAFLRGVERAVSVEEHLAACEPCRRLLLELARLSTRNEGSASPSSPSSAERLDIRDPGERYVRLEALGSGGMGIVCAAYDIKLDRKIALKMLRPHHDASTASDRLVREATTLARLSHRNIVAVYDVGRFDDRVYIAMELVEGSTLRRWLNETPRPWREVLARLVEAGRGLAAAHSAGVVHRDFKPENVLIGQDGRVCVTDFGLARFAAEYETAESARPRPTSNVEGSLTRTGALIGTPFYMAPEQLEGARASELSDQFGFCVTLYEALYGTRPFQGDDLAELQALARAKRIAAPPRDREVPTWLRRCVVRGLDPDPERRYPSLTSLLAALERDPRTPRRRAMVLLAAGVAVPLAFVAGGRLRAEDTRCPPDSPELLAAWGPEARGAVESAFGAVDRPYAASALRTVVEELDAYAGAWNEMRVESCRATHHFGTQSEALLDLRTQCLQRRLGALRATTELLVDADPHMVARARDVVTTLPATEGCADVEALQSMVPLPDTPEARAEFESIGEQIAQARALLSAGLYERGLTVAASALERARGTGHDPTLADALFVHGNLQHALGSFGAAESQLREALAAAERGRHDRARGDILSTLAWMVGSEASRIEEALALGQQSRAVIARLGGDEISMSKLLDNLGVVYRTADRLPEALDHHRQALEIRRRVLPPEDPALGVTANNVGAVLNRLGEVAEAEAYFEQALGVWERSYGSDHPRVGLALHNLGATAYGRGAIERGLEFTTRALAIRESALGPDHPDTAATCLNLGILRVQLRQPDEALELFERARAVLAETLGEEHPYTVEATIQAGAVLVELGRLDEARRRLELVDEAQAEPGSLAAAFGELSLAEGHPAAALEHLQRALEQMKQAHTEDDAGLVHVLNGIGRAHLRLGQPGLAVEALERAFELAEKIGSDSRTDTEFELARALWAAGTDRARAIALAEEARERRAQADDHPARVAEIDAWLVPRSPR